jgi:tripartite-type tricarboxylate transporter receptor subunit TctC
MPSAIRPGRRALLGAAALPFLTRSAAAQSPDGPVTIVVPYTPGTGNDILARLLAPFLGQRLGQPVLVDNRAGASGNIGSQYASRAAPDGRTLLLQVNTFVMNPSLFRQMPYDPIAGFTPIGLLARGTMALAVNVDLQVTDVAGFAALARARPDSLAYATPGYGTPHHLAMALFCQVAQVSLNHVPYRGTAPAVQDLLGRRVAAMFLPIHVALPLAEAGQIRLLAVGDSTRAAAAPNLPTLEEAGFPGFQVDLWYGLLGPAGLPRPLVVRLNEAGNAWLALPATREALAAQGMVPTADTPEAFATLIAADQARWARVIRDAGITAD